MTAPQNWDAADETKADDTKADDTKADKTKADDTKADDTKADEIKVDETASRPSLDLTSSAMLRGALEAVLFIADAPLSVEQLAMAVQRPVPDVVEALAGLTAELDERGSGIQLRPAATGFRLYTRERFASLIEGFLVNGQRTRLSQAALETLAVIAYRQPVTRARISAIRGVNVDGVVRTLLARELIVEVGQDPATSGGLYRTTETFLEKMGITSVDELPSLAPLLPELDSLDSDEL